MDSHSVVVPCLLKSLLFVGTQPGSRLGFLWRVAFSDSIATSASFAVALLDQGYAWKSGRHCLIVSTEALFVSVRIAPSVLDTRGSYQASPIEGNDVLYICILVIGLHSLSWALFLLTSHLYPLHVYWLVRGNYPSVCVHLHGQPSTGSLVGLAIFSCRTVIYRDGIWIYYLVFSSVGF